MRRKHWSALLFLSVFLLNGSYLGAQESRITPGRRVIYPSFEVDVLVNGRRLGEYESRGRTYVEAIRGEEYEIRLRNRSSEAVAVALSVDGLNTIDASRTSSWNASKWVIEPYQTITISGWQMDSDFARRFYFTSERNSYAAKLGVRENLGVISAVFYRERRRVIPITPPPCRMPCPVGRADSQSASNSPMSAEAPTAGAAKSSRSRDEAATGIGRSVRNDVEYVDMELESRPAAVVTICYDYGAGPRGSISESSPKYRVRGKRDN
jgi:hypothetical protein